MLTNVVPLNAGAKILDRIVAEIFTVTEWKSFLYKHFDNLSLFLTIRNVYLDRFQGQLKEHETVYNHDIFGEDAKTLSKISKIIVQSMYLFPRLHSSVQLIITEIYRTEKTSDRFKRLTELIQ
jgi:hypothetical protein